MRRFSLLLVLLLAGCNDKSSSSSSSVTVTPLPVNDANCPAGGAAITTAGTTSYACNGQPGAKGDTGAPGVPGVPGAQGLPGIQGPPGGGYYVSRNNVYCDSVLGSDAPAGYSFLIAKCRAPKDLPLSGSCAQWDRDDVVLGEAWTTDWAVVGGIPTQPATYTCSWAKGGVAVFVSTIPSARAQLCCVAVPTN